MLIVHSSVPWEVARQEGVVPIQSTVVWANRNELACFTIDNHDQILVISPAFYTSFHTSRAFRLTIVALHTLATVYFEKDKMFQHANWHCGLLYACLDLAQSTRSASWRSRGAAFRVRYEHVDPLWQRGSTAVLYR